MARAAPLTADQARRLALRAQGLLGAPPRRPDGVLRQVAALQLDTISVLARSHELVCYARLGPVGREAVEEACWGRDQSLVPGAPAVGTEARAVEYWAHAACVLPVDSWPWFAFRRRHFRRNPRWGLIDTTPAVAEVRQRLVAEGPLTARQLGGSKQDGEWWDWSPMKVAVERLLDLGEVVCTTRRGWRRVYDLADRALPARVLEVGEPTDDECHRHLVAVAGRCLGVATERHLAEYFRLTLADVARSVSDSGLVPVAVDGWPEPAWADQQALDGLGGRGRHRSTLLSPFDSLIWDRARTLRLFGFTHRLEAYTPKDQRVHGYYVMPLLAGGRIVGRVDPKRQGRTLVARQVSLVEPFAENAVAVLAGALAEAAQWVGCDTVVVEQAAPEWLGPALTALLP